MILLEDGLMSRTTPPVVVAVPAGVTVLDLDRTVTRRGTFSPFLLQAAATLHPWRLALVPVVLGAMLAYRLRLLTRDRLKEVMHRLMLGRWIARADLRRVVEDHADRTLRRNLHADALGLIAREQAEGRLVILATAAHRFYAEAIARRLGIGEVVATESRWEGDRLSHRINGANCYGRAKADAVAARLAALGIARGAVRVRCYSDDRSDLPCFEASDEPVAVNPSPALVDHARANGWRIIDFR
jgi:HAD superfamily phosphoserine phosphatase-like hydrolase